MNNESNEEIQVLENNDGANIIDKNTYLKVCTAIYVVCQHFKSTKTFLKNILGYRVLCMRAEFDFEARQRLYEGENKCKKLMKEANAVIRVSKSIKI